MPPSVVSPPPLANRTVFVTGASGFIGTHLVERLLRQGCEVRCLIRPTTPATHLLRPNVVRVSGSLTAPESYRRALGGCDVVFHVAGLVAARRPAELIATNGQGTARLAEACADRPTPPTLVTVSSLAAAGPPRHDRGFRDETDAPHPVSHYGVSKRAGEIELQKRAGRLPITIVQPGIVYGARDRKVAAMFKAIARSGIHFVVGFQTPRLSLIHVDDLVQLLLLAATSGERLDGAATGDYSPSGYYLACDDRAHPTYWQLGQRVARALDRRVVVWPLLRPVGWSVGAIAEWAAAPGGLLSRDKIREATVPSWACSAAKARSRFGFRPAMPLDARLRQTASWFSEHGWL